MSITPDDARWMLGYYDLEGGEKPGDFRTSLITTIAKADPGNRCRLALGFPGTVEAFEAQQDVEGLQAIARSASPEPPYVCLRCGAYHATPRSRGAGI
jgi:hypothetical protein